MSKLKVAVIGIGYLGEFHAEKYKYNKNVDLIGVVDTDEKRCKKISKKFNTKSYKKFQDIINDIDAVSIVVPTNLHYKIAKFFIEHKKHVLIEKPFATNISQAKKLRDISKKNNTILQVGHLERFNKAFIGLKDKVNKPLYIECNRISPYKLRGTEVDVIKDLMIHDLDLIISLNNSRVKNIQANGINVLTNKIDIANARITFDNGCVCNLSSSRISDKVERKMRVFQKNSYFSLDFQKFVLDSYKKLTINNKKIIKKEQIKFLKNDSLKDEIQSFIHCINNNKEPIVTSLDGINALEYAIKISKLIKNDSTI